MTLSLPVVVNTIITMGSLRNPQITYESGLGNKGGEPTVLCAFGGVTWSRPLSGGGRQPGGTLQRSRKTKNAPQPVCKVGVFIV